MKYSVVAISLAALATAAAAQDPLQAPASTWQFFTNAGGQTGASVRAADGSQLILKCDKPGRREVHAIVLSTSKKLGYPNTRPVSRPITFQFDGAAPKTEDWGFFESHAIAQGKNSNDRSLARFVDRLGDARKVDMRLQTEFGDVDMSFDVAGAGDAITRVYETCKDSVPS
jgi:hypothetical protein